MGNIQTIKKQTFLEIEDNIKKVKKILTDNINDNITFYINNIAQTIPTKLSNGTNSKQNEAITKILSSPEDINNLQKNIQEKLIDIINLINNDKEMNKSLHILLLVKETNITGWGPNSIIDIVQNVITNSKLINNTLTIAEQKKIIIDDLLTKYTITTDNINDIITIIKNEMKLFTSKLQKSNCNIVAFNNCVLTSINLDNIINKIMGIKFSIPTEAPTCPPIPQCTIFPPRPTIKSETFENINNESCNFVDDMISFIFLLFTLILTISYLRKINK